MKLAIPLLSAILLSSPAAAATQVSSNNSSSARADAGAQDRGKRQSKAGKSHGARPPSAKRPPAKSTRPPSAKRPPAKSTRPPARSSRGAVKVARGVRFGAVHPYHGVFVWGPSPVYHTTYVGGSSTVSRSHMPTRSVDRNNTLALGFRMGSVYSGYSGSAGYADLGMGLNVRYRPVEAIGFEFAHQGYAQKNADSDRLQQVSQFSVELFAVPWSRVSPYLLGGVTINDRQIDDDFVAGSIHNLQTADTIHGLHAGLGLEIAIGSNLAVDLEARAIGYTDLRYQDPSLDTAVQTTASVIYHF